MDLYHKSFTGLKIPEQPISEKDYVHGADNNPLGAVGLRVIVPNGNWKIYVPFGQEQYNYLKHWDTDDCTGFGYCNVVATEFNTMWKLGMLSQGFIVWARANNYIQKDGTGAESFMFDPQVLGIMAGTTDQGNWLQVVAETARKSGLLPAGTLPGPDGYDGTAGYYDKALVTQKMTDLGQDFLAWVNLPYQWIGSLSEAQALQACPLYVALCTCSGWNNPPVSWCGITQTNHCVEQPAHEDIQDSYKPFDKALAADYGIPFQMMILAAEAKLSGPVDPMQYVISAGFSAAQFAAFSPEVQAAIKFNDRGGRNVILNGAISKRDPRFVYP